MAAADLEQRIGKLSGQLEAVASALERMESRQDSNQQRISTLEQKSTEIERIRDRLDAGDRDFGLIRLDVSGLKTGDIAVLRRTVDELKKDQDSSGKRTWDVLKIILAAAVSAAVSILLMKNPSRGESP